MAFIHNAESLDLRMSVMFARLQFAECVFCMKKNYLLYHLLFSTRQCVQRSGWRGFPGMQQTSVLPQLHTSFPLSSLVLVLVLSFLPEEVEHFLCLSHASFYTQKSPTVTTVVSKQPKDSRRLTSKLFVHR